MSLLRTLLTVLLIAIVCRFVESHASAKPVALHAYELNGNLDDSRPAGLAIKSEGGTLGATAYEFNPVVSGDYNQGLTLESAALSDPGIYSIEMRVKFSSLRNITDEPWVALIGFKNGALDAGFYLEDFEGFGGDGESSKIEFFGTNYAEIDEELVFPNQWAHIVATRNAEGEFAAYVDGNFAFDMDDSELGEAVFDAENNIMRFLQDDDVSPAYDPPVIETTTGVIDYLRIYDYALALEEVALLSRLQVPGDYDGNLEVDLDDYAEWKLSYGDEPELPGSGADGNGDGRVDAGDYVVWRNHLPITMLSIAAAHGSTIPEPSGIVAIWAAALSLCGASTRRARG